MAFGTGSNSYGPNTKLYSFRIKTKDLPAPLFEVSRRVGDKYEPITDKVTRVNGTIIGLQHKVFKYEGKDIKSVTVTMRDKDDVYFVTVGYTFIGRNILNSILALKTFDDIEIALYQSKPKPDAVIKTGFASASVRQGAGQDKHLIYGLYKKEQLPVIAKVKINGQTMSDTSEIDLFFEKAVVEFSKVVKAAAPAQTASTGGGEPAAAAEEGDLAGVTGADVASIENPTPDPF